MPRVRSAGEPRRQHGRAVSLGGSAAIGGSWDDSRLHDAGELELVRVNDGSPWQFSARAGGKEIGRIAFVGPGRDPGGSWLWGLIGPSGHAPTYADAVVALRARWAAGR